MSTTKSGRFVLGGDGVGSEPLRLNASWRLNSYQYFEAKPLYRTLDVIINNSTLFENKSDSGPDDVPFVDVSTAACKASQFLVEQSVQHGSDHSQTFFKLILPASSGFCVRSDFLERRLEGYEAARRIASFLEPRQEVTATDLPNDASSCLGILAHAVGAVQVDDSRHMAELEQELVNRLSLPWISSVPIPERRIAWIKGKTDFESSRRIWEAAQALGIKLVILDFEGHWLQKDDPQWRHLREAFVGTDISADGGFVERIVATVRSYKQPVHGITTVSNALLPLVAQACEILGFETSPSASFFIAGDKFKTREMELDDQQSFRVFGEDELHERLETNDGPYIEYPVIVKPCMGAGSEGVSKANDEEQLIHAVARASNRNCDSSDPRTDVLIEPYIDGPEIDVNIVLIDGEIAFFEITDDFPKIGDIAQETLEASFAETSMVLPTALSEKEIHIARESVHQSLLRQGFRTGIFHCEGRIRNASEAYTEREGVLDLYPVKTFPGKEPSFYLHEINARPGGYFVTIATLLTYGVDYYAFHILRALGDIGRCRALSVPFLHGAQWWLEVVLIPEDKAGLMKTPDAGKDMLDRHADLRAAVVDYSTQKKGGDMIPGPHSTTFSYLAYFSVASSKSRADCLRLAQKVRKEFTYEVENEHTGFRWTEQIGRLDTNACGNVI